MFFNLNIVSNMMSASLAKLVRKAKAIIEWRRLGCGCSRGQNETDFIVIYQWNSTL
jgi:hypothetical protein